MFILDSNCTNFLYTNVCPLGGGQSLGKKNSIFAVNKYILKTIKINIDKYL